MIGIGYTVTRSGLPIVSSDLLEGVKFTATTFSQVSNTSSIYTPYNGSGQSIDLGGAKWQGVYTFTKVNLVDDQFGKIKAWKAKLRGSAGRFLGHDPSWCNGSLQNNKNFSDTVTVVMPEINGGSLYPGEFYPGAIYPGSGYFSEYTFDLTYVYEGGEIKVREVAESGNSLRVSFSPIESFINSNPWDESNGVHPLYEQYLNEAKAELRARNNISNEYGVTEPLIKEGGYFQINDHLAMVVDADDPNVLVFEPPLRNTVFRGDIINTSKPSCVMHLVDDEQVKWSASGIIAEFVSFTAMETFT